MTDDSLIDYFKKLVKRGDFGEIKILNRSSNSILREKGKNRFVTQAHSSGFGIRIYRNGLWALASDTNLTEKALTTAVERAYASIPAGKKGKIEFDHKIKEIEAAPPWKKDMRDVDISDKLDLIKGAEEAARIKKINMVTVAYADQVDHWVISNTNGGRVSFYESYPRMMVSSFVKDQISMQSVTKSLGGNGGFEIMDYNKIIKIAKEASADAIKLIGAKPVKGGNYDVVLDHSMTGVYTHEAFGHATEADAVMNKSSILENKLGRTVGPDIVTIIDDPTIKDARGSYMFDQEGSMAKKRILVENGVLKSYLHSNETAEFMGLEPNGAARAMSYSSNPIPRMSNTFIAPGNFGDDIIDGIKEGIAFYGFQYGYTDPGSGKFMFKSQYGRTIKNGMFGDYVRDAALAGSTLDVLNKIDAIGKDLKLDEGTCGKLGQWVPVTSGGPKIRIRGVVVGGQ